jgi:SAM-dependent methyltransferase
MSQLRIFDPAALCAVAPGGHCEFGQPRAFQDRSGRVGEVSVRRCRHCGHGITHPPLANVAFLYADRASQDFQPTTAGLAHRIKRLVFRLDASRLLRQVGIKPRRTLDFGCGSGLFTRCLGDLQAGGEVVGSDFHEQPPADLAGRPYVPNAELDAQQGSYDLVLAMHVIEHDDDPAALVRRIVALGRTGSSFVFEVPNVDCAWARVFGEAWDAWYVPFHRIHFSRTSFRALIERSGLVIEREIDVCLPSLGRTLANLLGRRNTLPLLLAGIALHPIQWLGERLTQKPSALRIIARKR